MISFTRGKRRGWSRQILSVVPLTLVVLFLSFVPAQSEDMDALGTPIFTAVASKIIYPFSTYKVSVFVEPLGSSQPVRVKAFLQSENGETLRSPEMELLPGKAETLRIEADALKEKDYNLTVSLSDSRERKVEKMGKVLASRKDKSILIQADKPIYKPGETVRFRILILDRHLKPLAEDQLVDIKILDGQRNLIKVWADVNVESGFYKNSLELSTEPILGDWNIEVKAQERKKEDGDGSDPEEPQVAASAPGARSFAPKRRGNRRPRPVRPPPSDGDGTERTLSFSVEQYVLPKYKVDISPPTVVTFKNFKFPVRVEAKYTYGKGVAGSCNLVVKKAYFYRFNDEEEPIVSKTFPINGSETVEMDISTLFKDKDPGTFYDQEIKFEASVKEEVTGKELTGSNRVLIHKNEYKMEEIRTMEQIKPGLPYSTVFKISTQDNIPVHDEALDALQVKHGFSFDAESGKFATSIPASGLVSMTFPTPTNELIHPQRVDLKYKDLTTTFHMPGYYQSSSGTYMQVKRPRGNGDPAVTEQMEDPVAIVGEKVIINVNTTRPFQTINYIIHGRQDVLAADIIHMPEPVKDYNLEVICPAKADPEARIVIYTVLTDNKEVLADSLRFKARRLDPDNFLNLTLSDKTREPGEEVTLKLETIPGSTVALRAVDQSVLLLKEDKDITQDTLDEEMRSRESESVWANRNWGGSDALRIFEEGGLLLITNANVELKEQPEYGGSFPMHSKVAAFALSAEDSRGATFRSTGNSAAGIRVRTNFPETWLWEEVSMNDSAVLDLQKIVPDTLTSWIISGYSLNSDAGVGVLRQAEKLTTFRPFFLSLNLPYSVVKGEVLLLQVLVHNYLPGDNQVTAEITLDNAAGEFEFADPALQSADKQTKSFPLAPSGVSSVKFAITPKKFGFITLKVEGRAGGIAGDALSRPLRVVPPGHRQQQASAVLLRQTDQAEEAKLEAVFPDKRVEGADGMKLTLISDILGPTLSNMDKLIELPTGCGEQNMMSFVADIVILNYLKATLSLDDKVRDKAISYLEKGYQRQLTYRRNDGSYSAFGDQDSSGSTWLTAFVVRSFIQAKAHITIDDGVIKDALDFLGKQQTDNGGFYEIGRVFQQSLQGGANSNGVALSAYVLLAFIEARNNWNAPPEVAGPPGEEVPVDRRAISEGIVNKAIEFVTKKTESGELKDPYALVITTYAAHLAGHHAKNGLFQMMQAAGKTDQGYKFWEVEKNNLTDSKRNLTAEERSKIYWFNYMTQPVSVEMTSYGLLTYLLRGEAPQAFPLVRWLLNKRNSNGGFLSTQDTVVGLTALAQYAQLTKSKNVNLDVTYNSGAGSESVSITGKNAQVLQEYELPQETRTLDVSATGEGAVLAQLGWTYYVEDPVQEPAFAVKVKTEAKPGAEMAVGVCTSYAKEGSSNMAIIEINLPSGYTFESESLEALKYVNNYKRHDVENENTQLQVYLDAVSAEEICIPVVANRVFQVGKQAPAYVSVYDYYDTTKRARTFYDAPQLSACEICTESQDCGDNNCV